MLVGFLVRLVRVWAERGRRGLPPSVLILVHYFIDSTTTDSGLFRDVCCALSCFEQLSYLSFSLLIDRWSSSRSTSTRSCFKSCACPFADNIAFKTRK